jgi:hypothetical protein
MRDLLRLGRWILPYRKRLAAAIACSLVSVLCLTAGIGLVKPIVEEMMPRERTAATADSPGSLESSLPDDLRGSLKAWVDDTRERLETAFHIPQLKAWLGE